jgi:hypothetical protein
MANSFFICRGKRLANVTICDYTVEFGLYDTESFPKGHVRKDLSRRC